MPKCDIQFEGKLWSGAASLILNCWTKAHFTVFHNTISNCHIKVVTTALSITLKICFLLCLILQLKLHAMIFILIIRCIMPGDCLWRAFDSMQLQIEPSFAYCRFAMNVMVNENKEALRDLVQFFGLCSYFLSYRNHQNICKMMDWESTRFLWIL